MQSFFIISFIFLSINLTFIRKNITCTSCFLPATFFNNCSVTERNQPWEKKNKKPNKATKPWSFIPRINLEIKFTLRYPACLMQRSIYLQCWELLSLKMQWWVLFLVIEFIQLFPEMNTLELNSLYVWLNQCKCWNNETSS